MKICFTGDSISAGVDISTRQSRSVGDYIAYQLKDTLSRNITYPSDGIDEQTIRWNQISENEKLEFDYIISMNGNNDGLEKITSDYPAFFTLIKNEVKASCRIIQLSMSPYGGVEALDSRNVRNAALLSLENIDAFVVEHTSYLDDGTNNVKAAFYRSVSDKLHLNVAGRIIVADAVVQKMRELKWI